MFVQHLGVQQYVCSPGLSHKLVIHPAHLAGVCFVSVQATWASESSDSMPAADVEVCAPGLVSLQIRCMCKSLALTACI